MALIKPCLFLAGVLGIEPSSAVLETVILPMYYTPKTNIYNSINNFLLASLLVILFTIKE